MVRWTEGEGPNTDREKQAVKQAIHEVNAGATGLSFTVGGLVCALLSFLFSELFASPYIAAIFLMIVVASRSLLIRYWGPIKVTNALTSAKQETLREIQSETMARQIEMMARQIDTMTRQIESMAGQLRRLLNPEDNDGFDDVANDD